MEYGENLQIPTIYCCMHWHHVSEPTRLQESYISQKIRMMCIFKQITYWQTVIISNLLWQTFGRHLEYFSLEQRFRKLWQQTTLIKHNDNFSANISTMPRNSTITILKNTPRLVGTWRICERCRIPAIFIEITDSKYFIQHFLKYVCVILVRRI